MVYTAHSPDRRHPSPDPSREHVDRALFFVRTMDILNSLPGPIVLDVTAEESRRIRRELREQWAQRKRERGW